MHPTPATIVPSPAGIDVLLCRLSAHRVALSLAEVREVTWIVQTTPVPGAPPWLTGLLDCRGELVPLVDVEARMARRGREPALSELVVICATRTGALAVLVRDVLGVAHLSLAEGTRTEREPWVGSVLQDGDGPVLLLDLTQLGALT